MADEATLTIRFRDESSSGPSGGVALPKDTDLESLFGIELDRLLTMPTAGQKASQNNPASAAGPPSAAGEPVKPAKGEDSPSALPKPPPLSREQLLAEAEAKPPPVQGGGQPAVGEVVSTAAQFGQMIGRAQQIQSAAQGIASGSALGAAGGITSLLASAGPAAAGIAGAIGLPLLAAHTLSSIAETARNQVRNLSPEAASAEAEANVRQIMANMRTSRILGDEVATIVQSNARLSAAAQGIRDTAAEPFLRQFGEGKRTLAVILESIDKRFAESRGVQTLIQAALGGDSFRKFNRWLDGQNNLGAASFFDWFDKQPHLEPPAPFSVTDRKPFGAQLAPFPGLNLMP